MFKPRYGQRISLKHQSTFSRSSQIFNAPILYFNFKGMPYVMKDIKRAAAKSRQIIAKNERQLEVKKEKTNDT